jgi:hypothetical protein
MYQGSVASTGPERRDDVSVVDLWEFMALLGEPSNVVLKGFTQLLPTTLQIPRVAWLHVHTLEVASEDLLQIFLAIDCLSRQVVKPDLSHVE